MPRPPWSVGKVHTYQSVSGFWSSIWVAALDAPKRKLPFPDGSDVEPNGPNAISAGAAPPPPPLPVVTVDPPPAPAPAPLASWSPPHPATRIGRTARQTIESRGRKRMIDAYHGVE